MGESKKAAVHTVVSCVVVLLRNAVFSLADSECSQKMHPASFASLSSTYNDAIDGAHMLGLDGTVWGANSGTLAQEQAMPLAGLQPH